MFHPANSRDPACLQYDPSDCAVENKGRRLEDQGISRDLFRNKGSHSGRLKPWDLIWGTEVTEKISTGSSHHLYHREDRRGQRGCPELRSSRDGTHRTPGGGDRVASEVGQEAGLGSCHCGEDTRRDRQVQDPSPSSQLPVPLWSVSPESESRGEKVDLEQKHVVETPAALG